MPASVRLFLCGDVMLGRGIDQILPHPGSPVLQEPWVRDAREYVALAERANGPVDRPVDPSWLWGDALEVLDADRPHARIVNLETSITARGEFAAGKGVHYRMNPANISALQAIAPDVCVLANNHVMDFGQAGLVDTLDALATARLRHVGAGLDLAAARAVVRLPVAEATQVMVTACGTPSSGIPPLWGALEHRPGVHLLPDLSAATASALCDQVDAVRIAGDIAIVSIHWGSNWGYDIPTEQRTFARRLIDAGIDLVHGHSSHHPRPVEVYRDRLVLYGCGDFVNDYEGIRGHDEFRDDLRLMYLATLDASSGALEDLRMVPLRARRLRLEHAQASDRQWLASILDGTSTPYANVTQGTDGLLRIAPGPGRVDRSP